MAGCKQMCACLHLGPFRFVGLCKNFASGPDHMWEDIGKTHFCYIQFPIGIGWVCFSTITYVIPGSDPTQQRPTK